MILTLAGGLAFGAAVAAVHGSHGGVRATIGGLSAPWLLVAFAAGAVLGSRGVARGALAGLLVTAVALSAFYVTNIWVLGIFGHGLLGDLSVALSTGAYYMRLGLVSGPVMGAAGALWRRRRSMGLGLAATGLLVLEPLAWLVYWHGHLPPAWNLAPVAAAEIGVGLLASAALVAWQRRTARG